MSTARQPSHPLATLALTALTAVTAVGLCRLFADWAFLLPTLAVVVAGHLAAYLGRLVRVPAVIAVPLAAAVALAVAGVVFHRSSAIGGVFPSADTVRALRADLQLVLDQFSVTVAPVPSSGAFAAAAAMMVGLAGPLADTFAFRAYGRGEAVVPTLVVFVFCSALGADRNRLSTAGAWIGTALLTTAVLRATHRGQHEAWVGGRRPRRARALVAGLVVAGICAASAATAAPHLPGAGERSLLDTRKRQKETTEIVSPLVEIKAQLVNRSDTELFTVESDQPAYWRLMGLAAFDGETWSPTSERLRDTDGTLTRGAGADLHQVIRIVRLGGKLVPAAFSPARVDTDLDLQWAGQSQALLTPDDQPLSNGDVIDVVSRVPTVDAAALSSATSAQPPDAIFLSQDAGLPDAARRIGDQIAAANSTPYGRALALQTFFRDEFTYSLDVPRGHSNNAMRNFLETRVGYCEQFAGTFAAIARYIGVPSRVAVGFTPGDLQSDGTYSVRGKYAHAWPEVWFDGIGWVAFEPTPGRGAPGSESATGLAPQQEGEDAPPPTDPPVEDTVPPSEATTPSEQQPLPPPTVAPPEQQQPPVDTPSSEHWWWLWVVLGVGLAASWVVAMPEYVRRRRRRRLGHSPVAQVSGAWHEAERALARSGVRHTPGDPAPTVALAAADSPADPRAVAALADHVTRAMYSGAAPTDHDVAEAQRLADLIRDDCTRDLSWRSRVAGHLDPRRVP